MNIAILHPRALEALYPEAQYPEGYEAHPRSDYQEALARGDAAGLTYWQYVYRELKKESS